MRTHTALQTREQEQLVAVTLTGHPRAVTAIARALAEVAVVTGMHHHATDGPDRTGEPLIQLDATCYPRRTNTF